MPTRVNKEAPHTRTAGVTKRETQTLYTLEYRRVQAAYWTVFAGAAAPTAALVRLADGVQGAQPTVPGRRRRSVLTHYTPRGARPCPPSSDHH